jgi:hypothetical protein
MRGRRQRLENLAGASIIVLVMLTAFPSAFYVHANASQWETPGVFVSLGLGLVPAAWYFRTKRYGWVASILSGELLGFSFMSALFHGWEAVAITLAYAGIGAGAVVTSVLTYRILRRAESAMREVGEELSEAGILRDDALFRDDGERIIVYPNRRRFLLRCVSQALFLATIAGAFILFKVDNIVVLCFFGLIVSPLVALFLLYLLRLMTRRPTLIVGPDGILDQGSLVAAGMGLLRWHEILSVESCARSTRQSTYHYLSIVVADVQAIRKRQPLWKRLMLGSIVQSFPSQVAIGQSVLDAPVNELAEQIRHYVQTHAPAGWLDMGGDDDSDEDTEDDSGEDADDTMEQPAE